MVFSRGPERCCASLKPPACSETAERALDSRTASVNRRFAQGATERDLQDRKSPPGGEGESKVRHSHRFTRCDSVRAGRPQLAVDASRFSARALARSYAAPFCIIMRIDVTRRPDRISAMVSSGECPPSRSRAPFCRPPRRDSRSLRVNVAAAAAAAAAAVTFIFAGRLTKPLNPHRFPRCVPAAERRGGRILGERLR